MAVKAKSHASIFRRSKEEKEKKSVAISLKDGAKTSRSSVNVLSSSSTLHPDPIRKSTSDVQLMSDQIEIPSEVSKGKEEETEKERRVSVLREELKALEREANELLRELGREQMSERERGERRERVRDAASRTH